MKTKIFFALLFTFAFISIAKAQDTIDTAYYRYGNNFIRPEFYNPLVEDSVTGEAAVDPETGDPVALCPNGFGFTSMEPFPINHCLSPLSPEDYMYYKISGTGSKRPVYGIAISLDSVSNFMEGDSLIIIMCEPASDNSHFIHIDSIIIRGGEFGKRRWCEIPIAKDLSELPWTSVQDDCIDTVLYRSIMEFYFDEPRSISGSSVFWKVKIANDYGSVFHSTFVTCQFDVVWWFHEDCTNGIGNPRWDELFPILTPLPEWEVPSMEQLIPEREYNPAVHQPDPDPDPDPDPEGIDNIQNSTFKINIAPNPADSRTTVTCDLPITELTISDLAGRPLTTLRNCGTSASIDLSTLPQGLYLIKVKTSAGMTVKKLSVK